MQIEIDFDGPAVLALADEADVADGSGVAGKVVCEGALQAVLMHWQHAMDRHKRKAARLYVGALCLVGEDILGLYRMALTEALQRDRREIRTEL